MPKQNNTKVYQKLAKHLDNLPAGFPATGDGLELRLLQRLFTPEEAEMATYLTLIPETAKVVAFRAKKDLLYAADILEQMARKGQIYSRERPGKPTLYSANQIVIGIWEYHVQNLDTGLIEDMNAYIPALFEEAWRLPQLRTVPVNKSLTPKTEVTTYENAQDIIKQNEKIAVAPCICRREKKMMGEGCDRPEESCIILGNASDYYVRNGMGRYIDQNEALLLLEQANEYGLVLQPGNAQNAANICCCCGCCCGVLRTLKNLPRPVDSISSPFHAVSNPELCDDCQICATRCPMDALDYDLGYAQVNLDRCIGCGLCVTTCPTEALGLERKAQAKQPEVPLNNRELYLKLAKLRGKLGWFKIIKLFTASKFDRWRAA